jgi:hypothetical protein
VATGISEDIQAMLQQWGATAEHSATSVRIMVSSEHKREVVEKLWAAGHDVVSLHPVKGSLEDLYMKLVGGGAA